MMCTSPLGNKSLLAVFVVQKITQIKKKGYAKNRVFLLFSLSVPQQKRHCNLAISTIKQRQKMTGWLNCRLLFFCWGFFERKRIMENTDYFNDMWNHNIASNTWTWTHGSTTPNQNGEMKQRKKLKERFSLFFFFFIFCSGTFGTQGMGSTSTTPGGRFIATHWTDSNGNFWLYGGVTTSGKSLFLFFSLI